MSPEDKTKAVEYLQDLGFTVAMCGDGANDAGALKASHVREREREKERDGDERR